MKSNDRGFIDILLPDIPKQPTGENLTEQIKKFSKEDFLILLKNEAFCPIAFYDVGALVRYAKAIKREFPGFSVDRCFHRLLEAEKIKNEKGCIRGMIHRYLLVVSK